MRALYIGSGQGEHSSGWKEKMRQGRLVKAVDKWQMNAWESQKRAAAKEEDKRIEEGEGIG